jgi:hypothetical protein
MAMRISTLVTRLKPEDAYTVIEFLDQLRDLLIAIYGDEITAMLKEASQRQSSQSNDGENF